MTNFADRRGEEHHLLADTGRWCEKIPPLRHSEDLDVLIHAEIPGKSDIHDILSVKIFIREWFCSYNKFGDPRYSIF
jgi:hypothetical protein